VGRRPAAEHAGIVRVFGSFGNGRREMTAEPSGVSPLPIPTEISPTSPRGAMAIL